MLNKFVSSIHPAIIPKIAHIMNMLNPFVRFGTRIKHSGINGKKNVINKERIIEQEKTK